MGIGDAAHTVDSEYWAQPLGVDIHALRIVVDAAAAGGSVQAIALLATIQSDCTPSPQAVLLGAASHAHMRQLVMHLSGSVITEALQSVCSYTRDRTQLPTVAEDAADAAAAEVLYMRVEAVCRTVVCEGHDESGGNGKDKTDGERDEDKPDAERDEDDPVAGEGFVRYADENGTLIREVCRLGDHGTWYVYRWAKMADEDGVMRTHRVLHSVVYPKLDE